MAVEFDPVSGGIQWATSLAGPRRYGANAGFTATSGKLGSSGYRKRSRNNARRQAVEARLQQMGQLGASMPGVMGRPL